MHLCFPSDHAQKFRISTVAADEGIEIPTMICKPESIGDRTSRKHLVFALQRADGASNGDQACALDAMRKSSSTVSGLTGLCELPQTSECQCSRAEELALHSTVGHPLEVRFGQFKS